MPGLMRRARHVAQLRGLFVTASPPFGHASLKAFDEGEGDGAVIQALSATTMTQEISFDDVLVQQAQPTEDSLYPPGPQLEEVEKERRLQETQRPTTTPEQGRSVAGASSESGAPLPVCLP